MLEQAAGPAGVAQSRAGWPPREDTAHSLCRQEGASRVSVGLGKGQLRYTPPQRPRGFESWRQKN